MIRLLALMLVCFPLFAAEQAVKLSTSGICHTEESAFYDKIIKFTPYSSMEACLKAGGQLPGSQQKSTWGGIDCSNPDLEALGLEYMCTDR